MPITVITVNLVNLETSALNLLSSYYGCAMTGSRWGGRDFQVFSRMIGRRECCHWWGDVERIHISLSLRDSVFLNLSIFQEKLTFIVKSL